MIRARRALLTCAILLAGLGLATCLVLAWRHAHPSSMGVCGAGSGCDQALSSRYAALLGVPLACWGGLLFGTLAAIYVWAYALQGGTRYRQLLKLGRILGMLGTIAAGVMLYLQFGVLRVFCPLCTLASFLAVGVYVTGLRVPGEGAPDPQRSQAGLIGLGLVAGMLVLAAVLVLERQGETLARIDDIEITHSDMQREMALTLFDHATRTHEAKANWINWKIENYVIAVEAARRGMSVEAWVAAEIDVGIDASEAEIEDWVSRRTHIPTPLQLRERARADILKNKRQKRRNEIVMALRKKHDISVLLEPPDMPTVEIDTTGAHIEGPTEAPVRLVVFSEFECPFCAQLAPTLRRIRERFPRRVQVAFMSLPLDIHARSRPAALAAECAAAQGRFWPFHDRVFAHAEDLADKALRAHAEALGLDMAAYDACLAAGAGAGRLNAHGAEAERLGVSSVPSLFLNGRLIGGQLAFAELERMVQQELKR